MGGKRKGQRQSSVHGEIVTVPDRGEFYRITNYDNLAPFFMSIVSSSDCWLFISSTGGLTAGRRNQDHALFPYATEDKIHDAAETTGSKTIIAVGRRGERLLWEPFSIRSAGRDDIGRNIYKSIWANEVLFEEENLSLGLTFRYSWATSESFGFIRTAWLLNASKTRQTVQIVDGVQNLLPSGIDSRFQTDKSNLLDAYKKNELLPASGLGLFTLSSIPIDRPEPAESLRATTVWSTGMQRATRLLTTRQIDAFRDGLEPRQEVDVRAARGAYFVCAEIKFPPNSERHWVIGADVDQGPSRVQLLNRELGKPRNFESKVIAGRAQENFELTRLAGLADGLQKSNRKLSDVRHFHNVLFNIMRGGIFEKGYLIRTADFSYFLRQRNRKVAEANRTWLHRLPSESNYEELVAGATQTADPQLERLVLEYLPLTFSRRHGDPSRPWNRFEIPSREASGDRVLNYEGNWRDIFQNWEALALSFPQFLPSMIARFVNASNADGYNPYRIFRDGIDWEVVDPHDPWSFIGYWGDHQIVYLNRLLEALHGHDPGLLTGWLAKEIFTYADVPYRIKPFDKILSDPKNTVVFDDAAETQTRQRVERLGSDGKYVVDDAGQPRLVNFAEKLIVPILVKLVNFVPEAGVWLNTQRPEWNDANNALVGNGASVVTLCQLRRHLIFCRELFAGADKHLTVSSEVASLLQAVSNILTKNRGLLRRNLSDQSRFRVMRDLGQAGSAYRKRVYEAGLAVAKAKVPQERFLGLFDLAIEWADHSIAANRRADGLFHSYNLLTFGPKRVGIRRLYEMLEGQVAVLGCGFLSAAESGKVLGALRRSKMYRADQKSYLLYPDRKLPRFTEKNVIRKSALLTSRLLRDLLKAGDTRLIERDCAGRLHFSGSIRNSSDVEKILNDLRAQGYNRLVDLDGKKILDLFEEIFDHQSFTGRSGTFFGYEGLGCIYWHMVSKLLVSIQETLRRAIESGQPRHIWDRLASMYFDIRAALGDMKTPEEYGAFPMDPYSHTPGQGGARQPGLTGQVKEDIINRFGELGVVVRDGEIHFDPRLLRKHEFLPQGATFRYFDAHGVSREIAAPAGSLAFTICGTPVVYTIGSRDSLAWRTEDDSFTSETLVLPEAPSLELFRRNGQIREIQITLDGKRLRD